MSTISDSQYNKAKAILEKAGSKTAEKSHKKHGNSGGAPIEHGQTLVDEATAEFQKMDKSLPHLTPAKMTQLHYDAIVDAKKALGLN